MRNTADVTGGKPIAVLLQSISGVSAINPFVAFYDIYGEKREVLFFYFVPTPHKTTDVTSGNQSLFTKHSSFNLFLIKLNGSSFCLKPGWSCQIFQIKS
jgi:hypothetical protein